MNLYENAATEAIVLLFKKGKLWQKELVFNYLLEPFKKNDKEPYTVTDIKDVISQDNLKDTIPDFTIILSDDQKIRYEVKINNVGLTESEKKDKTREAFLVVDDYAHMDSIKNPIRTWNELFSRIDKKEATDDFAILDLVRNYLFGSVVNKDYEFLSRFLYSEQSVDYAIKNTFKELLELIAKPTYIAKPGKDLAYSLGSGKNKIIISYEHGGQYKSGHFFLTIQNKKEEIPIESTTFLKPYDKVLYFYEKIWPEVKSNICVNKKEIICKKIFEKSIDGEKENITIDYYRDFCFKTILQNTKLVNEKAFKFDSEETESQYYYYKNNIIYFSFGKYKKDLYLQIGYWNNPEIHQTKKNIEKELEILNIIRKKQNVIFKGKRPSRRNNIWFYNDYDLRLKDLPNLYSIIESALNIILENS